MDTPRLTIDDLISNFKNEQLMYLYRATMQGITYQNLANCLQLINLGLDATINQFSEVNTTLRHNHDSHSHIITHSFNDNGTYFTAKDVNETDNMIHNTYNNYADVLWLEYLKDTDFDENSMIYNKHFIIDPNDDNRPIKIRYMEKLNNYNFTLPKFTWSKYMTTLSSRIYHET